MALATGLGWIDTAVARGTLDWPGPAGLIGPDGARALLSTIAGSTITVAGVLFSITILVLSTASAQFGPRLLGNFMRHGGTQIVLGTFLGTFVFCLLVLGRVRSEPEVEFVPQASVAAGLTLGIVSFALLIYFLHHVSVFIRAPRIIDDVAHTLERTLRASFPERQGESRTPDEEGETEKREAGDSAPVAANATGYVQALDYDGLVGAAVEHEALIVLRFRPGQFVAEGRALADVAPPGALESTELGKKINEAFLLGPERTATQDPEFAVHQLVEIALRALSPGINDPHTAINCIDRLSAGLALLGTRELPSRYLRDEDDALRLVIVPLTYAGVVAAAFDPIREAAQGHLAVVVRMIDSLAMIGAGDLPDPYREALIEQLRALCRDSDTAGFADRDAEKLARACEAARDALTQPEHPS